MQETIKRIIASAEVAAIFETQAIQADKDGETENADTYIRLQQEFRKVTKDQLDTLFMPCC